MLPESSLAAAERYALLTLAIESAIIEGRYVEAQAMFLERDRCIDRLTGMRLSPEARAKLERSQLVDQRILALLQRVRTDAALQLAELFNGRIVPTTYAGGLPRMSTFDQAG